MFVMPCAIVALLSLYLSFLYFGLLVQTWSRPYGLCHCPYPLAHIKGFGSSLSACLCLLVSILYACVSLSCSRLCHVWHPQWVCSCVVTFDTHEALSGSNHLGCIAMMPLLRAYLSLFRSVWWFCLPCLFVPLVSFLCISTCLFTCSCMSLSC